MRPDSTCMSSFLSAGPVHACATEAAIVIPVGQREPTTLPLAENISFGRLTLGLQRIEFLFQSFFGGFARVDGAAKCVRLLTHESSFVSPKNVNPFHRVPVTFIAIELSESYLL